MRIQHNIPAMSAYRHYTNNTSALAKNLEKLSSGYRINRAGDDAAGLAISEKMRAQITGLEVAQKNAKDGISLVQTAEGALTEVHDMLNRMYALAEQSANGTYDTFDREQLQKEVDSLRTEIDRIAKSSNFNGISLLDGSMRQGTAGETQVALNKAYLEKLSFDGQRASEAGKAEITFDFASVGSNKVVTAKIDKNTAKTFDGVEPTAATQTEISFTLGAAGDNATVLGTTINPNTTDLASLGSVALGSKTVADLFDLYDGTALVGGSNDHTDWTTTMASVANKTYTLKAKNPGSLGDAVKNAIDAFANTETATTVVAHGVDEGRGAPETQAVYDITFDLTNIAGGQTIEIAGEKFLISNDPSVTAGTTVNGATVISIAGLGADTQVTPAANDKSLYDIADAIRTQINTKLGSLFTVDTLDPTDITQTTGKYNLKLTGTQGAKSTFDAVHVTNSNGQDITDATLTFTPTREYAPAGADNLGKNAQITYKNAVDINKLTAGSKIQIGGSVDTNGTVTGTGITIEIAETKADENFATGKIYLGDLASTADKIAYINSAIARVNGAGATFAAKLEPASGTVCNLIVTGGMSDKALTDGAGTAGLDASTAVSTFYKNNAAVQGTINGTTVEVGKTTYQEILDISLGSGFGTIGENFDIYKVTTAGSTTTETQLTGASLNTVIDGSSIVLKAKTAGQLDETNVMSKVTDVGGSGISMSRKDGWDEGQNEAGKTTSYELKFTLAKLAGGQSFSIGNSTGSITFDISVDPDSVNNGVQADGANGTEVANRKTLDLSKVDLTNLSDEDNKTAIINAFEGVVGTNGMSATDWKASASIDTTSGVLTLKIKAEKGDEKFNLGTIRYSQSESSENAGAISGAKYTVYNSSKGGQQGTYAKVVYDLDVSKFQKGDVLTFAGKTVEIGDKSGTYDDGTGTEKNYISLADAKSATKLAEKLESMLGADQTFAGRVQVDNSAKQLTITDYQTGRKAEDFAAVIDANLTSNTRDLNAMTGGLLLQIGDTADTYNQLRVSINDCHAAAMIDDDSGKSIADIDISTQDGAADAMKVIKAAINYVSDVRGTLGATQNRLDHTINNLSVMRENIQDAESTIRDVDVAEEMMAYTKNNILVQSAQAMLAQANQLPQGVLQLLQ